MIVAAERDTPGIMAMIWKNPILEAVDISDFLRAGLISREHFINEEKKYSAE